MSSTAWLMRRSVSLGLSEHSPARSHRGVRIGIGNEWSRGDGGASRRGWLPDRRRVHDHVRDGGDGRYGVVLHLRDNEVDG
jgi:hypothetical protein